MKNLIFNALILCFLIFTLQLKAENSDLDKVVNLQAGQITIKETLKIFSNQTGCIFSYEPLIIGDDHIINFSSNTKLTLRLALQKILPKNIIFNQNGKYIVLKKMNEEGGKFEKTTKKTTKPNILNLKSGGKIDNNPSKERSVLPSMSTNWDDKSSTNMVFDAKQNLNIDTTSVSKIAIKSIQTDTIQGVQIVSSQEKPILLSNLHTNNPVSAIKNNQDTTLIETSNFSKFITKNGVLETGFTFNNKLKAVSIRSGLYNIYTILSLGTDYNKSYLLGIGAGINFRLENHFCVNFDLLRNSLVGGKSYELNVRASNTQFSSILNYTIGRSFRIFGGPTFNMIKSSYISSISTSDLGMLLAVSISLGVKIDLKSLLFTKS